MTNEYTNTKRYIKQIKSLNLALAKSQMSETQVKNTLESWSFDVDFYDIANVNSNVQDSLVECLYGDLKTHLPQLKFYLESTLEMLEDF